MASAHKDLKRVMRETVARHKERCDDCTFEDGVVEELLASPEFKALADLIESKEIPKAKASILARDTYYGHGRK